MLAASAKFRPALAWFARQIAPSVLATLIAALVIAGYNRAFSGHLQQPRMSALHAAMDKAAATQATPAAAEADAAAKPKPAWTQMVEIIAPTGDIERSFDKDDGREAAKDQSKLKVAEAAPAVAPVAPRPVTARQDLPRQELRQELQLRQELREPRAAEPQVVVVDPRGPVPMAPPPGGYLAIQQPVQQQAEAPQQQRTGVLGAIVDTLKPSSLFRSAREFGDKIEAAGNDILPNIRQQ